MTKHLYAAVEGLPDEAAVSVLCELLGIEHTILVQRGKGTLDRKLSTYNQAAQISNWLVLRDLDNDQPCAPALVRKLVPVPSKYFLFRVAVRSIESWLMADRVRLSSFLQVSADLIPRKPDTVDYPKTVMINIASRSRSRDIREDMLPRHGSGASEGPAYASRLAEFCLYEWRPLRAASTSPSLNGCIARLRQIA